MLAGATNPAEIYMPEAKKFKNFTQSDFTWKFNGIPYTFKAGQEIYLESDKADHFAGHLVDQEMNTLGLATDNRYERSKLLAQCFPTDEVVSAIEALQVNEKAKPKKKVETEFADLEDTPKK